MADFKQQIDDALDILKFDGAVQDTLAELREKWSAQVPVLLEERFDAVGVQYMKLPHEKGVDALGQELSAFGWALYNLDAEDEYLFIRPGNGKASIPRNGNMVVWQICAAVRRK